MAKPLTDHLTALQAMREDVDELLTSKGLRADAIERLARARIAIADVVLHLREGIALAGHRSGGD